MSGDDDRAKQVVTIDWQGVQIEVTYEADWLGLNQKHGHNNAHLELRTIPPGTALPVTETGYRSHFLQPGEVEDAGGIVAYVTSWLDYMAQSREWKLRQVVGQQLSLF